MPSLPPRITPLIQEPGFTCNWVPAKKAYSSAKSWLALQSDNVVSVKDIKGWSERKSLSVFVQPSGKMPERPPSPVQINHQASGLYISCLCIGSVWVSPWSEWPWMACKAETSLTSLHKPALLPPPSFTNQWVWNKIWRSFPASLGAASYLLESVWWKSEGQALYLCTEFGSTLTCIQWVNCGLNLWMVQQLLSGGTGIATRVVWVQSLCACHNTIGILGENPTVGAVKQICPKDVLILKDDSKPSEFCCTLPEYDWQK